MPRETAQFTAQLYGQPGADPAALSAVLHDLPGRCSRNLPGSYGAGDYTWDFTSDSATIDGAATRLQIWPGIARVDGVRYEIIGGGQRAPDLKGGIKRTLLLRVKPGAAADAVNALQHDLLRMPLYVQSIRNWSLGRVISDSDWTHVWQQEFARVEDLLGEYMLHPYHWAWVDRWFDPECAQSIVDTALSHAYCAIEASVLAGRVGTIPESMRKVL